MIYYKKCINIYSYIDKHVHVARKMFDIFQKSNNVIMNVIMSYGHNWYDVVAMVNGMITNRPWYESHVFSWNFPLDSSLE